MACCANDGIAAIINQVLGDKSFIFFFINTQTKNLREVVATGNGQPNLNTKLLREISIPFPPHQEQTAIASALSDVDALLDGLDRLITKKRNLKQAAMQQLLTGKTRLAGFEGEWDVKTLNEVCWFQEGPGVRNTQFTTSGVKLLNGTNIFLGKLNLETTNRFISEKEAHGAYAHFLADEGDIVLASSGISIDRLHEKVAFVREQDLPFCMNTSTIRFKPAVEILDSKFLFQFLTSDGFKKPIGEQATGSAQLNFGPSHVALVDISIPPLPEQTAIAAVLADMDAEIAALEQRRTKTRDIKQGMMQELLTGRTRLV
jgi:type I restriction enzyme S subunit